MYLHPKKSCGSHSSTPISLGLATLHRPALLPVPGFALHIVVGEFAEDILGGQRVRPTKLLDAGFTFEHPTFEQAFAAER